MLGKETTLENFNIYDGGGSGNLVNIWKDLKYPLTDIIPQKVLLLFDCDNWLCENGTQEDFEDFGAVFELLDEVLDSPS